MVPTDALRAVLDFLYLRFYQAIAYLPTVTLLFYCTPIDSATNDSRGDARISKLPD
ncbi:hypothetical protein ACF3DV_31185 [Chlorogloeopsis fritschii PCC 9212]|uniref:hypothetical protein n=1 Tax=Chlorogloeopsis fritschii TaxID=1124 RepID=UPI000317DF88|nr:hypothetical protein [Chlorogloeopsis fritschii]